MLESIFVKEGFQIRLISPKPSPRGEGAPVRTLGRMRGRPGCPTGQEKKGVGATVPSFYKERLGTGSPPHPSPSVTASPQGEASGLCSPTRKSAPNQGTYMGTVIVPRPEQCGTIAKTSECQRAGHQKRGGGGPPPRLFASGLSLEKAWIPARDRAGRTTPQVPTCAGPRRDHLPTANSGPRPHLRPLWTPVQKAPHQRQLNLAMA